MAAPAGGEPRPLLVYDGKCGFCFYWARYWQKLYPVPRKPLWLQVSFAAHTLGSS